MNQSYEKALTKYIDSIRDDWGDENIDFTIIQLPIYDYAKAYKNNIRTATEVRAAQWNVSERLENVETVVAIDTGDAVGIHPNDKLSLIERTATAIMHLINPTDESIIYKSPSYASHTLDGDKMIITFKDVAGGLKTKDGELPRGFKIAGDDNSFVDAEVTLDGNTIVVDTSGISGTPKVRYAWEDCPALGSDNKTTTLNLINSAGLPMAPFRTDNERYMFKVNSDGSFGEAVNFTPMVRKITAGTIINGSAPITINARDYDDEIVSVEVFVDGTSIGFAEKRNDSEYSIILNNAEAGIHEVYAIATDTAGAASIKRDPSLGSNSVTPVVYPIMLKTGVDVEFTVEKAVFNNPEYSDGSWSAYMYTATINDIIGGTAFKFGAKAGEEIKYITDQSNKYPIITGSTGVCFGVIARSELEVEPVAEQVIE
jgi:hypothetical protein